MLLVESHGPMDPVRLPRITVITPSFEQARYLGWTMRSVLEQQYPEVEYLVVDGGSTDGSVDVIRSFGDSVAWWCSERDRGQAHAINKGLARATGEIVGWLNSDDMLLPRALDRVAYAFRDPSVQVICGWGVMMSEAGKIRRRWVFPELTADAVLADAPIFQPSVFWRRRVVDRIGSLDETMQFCLDREYWLRMVTHGIVPKTVRHCLAAYRKHDATKTRQLSHVGRKEYDMLQARFGRSARSSFSWRLRSACLRLLYQKLLIACPPLYRGLDVHKLYEPSRSKASSAVSEAC